MTQKEVELVIAALVYSKPLSNNMESVGFHEAALKIMIKELNKTIVPEEQS